MTDAELIRGISFFLALLISLSVHEWAHAYTAYKLGDMTAAKMGRLTLNPVAHIDLVGTVLLPLIIIFGRVGFFFGWAKPVPVDPTRFRRGVSVHTGMLITSVAGPASNILLAVLAVVAARVMDVTGFYSHQVFTALVGVFLPLNVLLAVFNMLPVPPLDGHRLLPSRIQAALLPYSNLIFMLFIVLIWTSGGFLGKVVSDVSLAIYEFVKMVI